MRTFGRGIVGLGAQALGRAFNIADDFVGTQWKWLTGKATKALKPKGMVVDANGVVNYNKKYRDLSAYGIDPKSFQRYDTDTFRGKVGDIAGKAYNNSRIMRRWAARLNRYGKNELNAALPSYKPGRAVSKGLKYTAYAGLGGGLAEIPFHMVDGGTDTTAYKVLHGANTINPFYHFTMNEYSPVNLAFSYATPLGLAMTGVGKGMEGIANGYADSAAQGARSAIEATSDALANMKFTDRLGYLFSPETASARYRSQALDQLAQTLGRPLTSTGSVDKDKALADILRTV